MNLKDYPEIYMICLVTLSLIFLTSCTSVNFKDVPYCKDLNVTGIDCHSPYSPEYYSYINMSDNMSVSQITTEFNWSNAICKEYRMSDEDWDNYYLCFDTLENLSVRFKETFYNYFNETCMTICERNKGNEDNGLQQK